MEKKLNIKSVNLENISDAEEKKEELERFHDELTQIQHDAVKIGGKIDSNKAKLEHLSSEIVNIESKITNYYKLEEKIEEIKEGVKEIITLGWDIGDVDKFYETGEEVIFQEHFDNSSEKIEYAKTSQTKLELETIINSTEFFNKWLKSKGVDFKIISDRNPAHKSIERMEFDAL